MCRAVSSSRSVAAVLPGSTSAGSGKVMTMTLPPRGRGTALDDGVGEGRRPGGQVPLSPQPMVVTTSASRSPSEVLLKLHYNKTGASRTGRPSRKGPAGERVHRQVLQARAGQSELGRDARHVDDVVGGGVGVEPRIAASWKGLVLRPSGAIVAGQRAFCQRSLYAAGRRCTPLFAVVL